MLHLPAYLCPPHPQPFCTMFIYNRCRAQVASTSFLLSKYTLTPSATLMHCTTSGLQPRPVSLTPAWKSRATQPGVAKQFYMRPPSCTCQWGSYDAGSDVRRVLEAQEVSTDAQESTSAKRNARKSDFMAAQFESKSGDTDMADQIKSKNNFALIAGLGFFVIPLAFLAVAYFSGYLSRLGAGSQL